MTTSIDTSQDPQQAPDAPEAPGTEPTPRARRTRGLLQRYALVIAWALVVVAFGALRPEIYLSAANFQTIFGSQAVLLLLALGLLLPLITGNFDLSIAANLTFSSILLAILQVQHDVPLVPAILVVLVAGVLVGVVNGFLVVGLGIDSFIATLGTSTVLQGLVLAVSDSQTISGISSNLINFAANYRFVGISLGFWYGVILTLVLAYLLGFTALGRRMLFVGRNPEVSRLSGVEVGRIQWGAFVGSGLIASVAGVVYTGSQGAADPTSGLGFLLPAFAACFLGSTAIQPGRFNPIGTFVAVFFLVSGITGLQILGAESYVQQLFYGGALVLAVALAKLPERRRRKKGA
ncbi:ABC transporter permease [Aeromicrobium sp. 50.2.37]|uniref:ABC transporter permease n=1 Tax=Aeromicrobium sp. 50.2.37 TaxID=2969305 RepID=UPI0021502422|nr:ABC transporter permease [Aeromicrobium sp. 50.2.37]MCR4514051.1 ABC transporter permease [Aeromicrobium sp. 50.2.37]